MRTSFCDLLAFLLFAGGLFFLFGGLARAAGPTGLASDASVSPAGAGADRTGAVVAVVKVKRPWYAPDFLVVRKMREAIPTYRVIPGLEFKAFSLARSGGEFGGLYLWRDRASAEAWFTPAWHRRIRDQRGTDAQVRLFAIDGPVRFAPGEAWEAREDAVATLVVPPPDTRGPDDADALIAYPIRTGGGEGMLLIWPDERTARRAMEAWTSGVAGQTRVVEWFDVPILMPGSASGDLLRRSGRSPLGESSAAGVAAQHGLDPANAVSTR